MNEGRRETQQDYRILKERSQQDWEAKEKRIFIEELGVRGAGGDRAVCTVGNEGGVYVGKKKKYSGSSKFWYSNIYG